MVFDIMTRVRPYRPKVVPCVSVTLTGFGKRILRSTVRRTKLSASDVVEQLLRDYARLTEAPPRESASV
jgi:hypothetical protein